MITNVLSMLSRHCKPYWLCLILFFAFSIGASAQTATAVSPSRVGFKSNVTITGTGLAGVTNVKFGTISGTVKTALATRLVVEVPTTLTSNNHTIYINDVSTGLSIAYVAPSNTPTTATVNRVITDYNDYWTTSVGNVNAIRPDSNHNMLAFGFGSKVFTTGVNNATLDTRGVSFEAGGDFRALPIDIVGSTSNGDDNYIIYGANIDGSVTAATLANASSVRVADVLMDGIKGLDLGTGVTNINSNATFEFDIARIADDKLNDDEPDIIITQIATPGVNLSDVYYFTDANGNLVGNPLFARLDNISLLGVANNDLFLLPKNTLYANAAPAATGTRNEARDMRMIGFRLSEFGITSANYGSITKFKVFPNGTSDMAFTAYNANAIFIPAPQITTQPAIALSCPEVTSPGTVTFSVTATGNGKYYQWKKDGVNIANATSATYTIATVTDTHVGSYTVEVRNVAGAVLSEPAFLGNQWTGALSSDWNTPGNWYCGLIPNTGLNANIPKVSSNRYPVLNVTAASSCKDLNIAEGASVTISGTGSLDIAGNISRTGVLNAVDGTVRFVGTTAKQTIPANTFDTNYIKNLTINNTNDVVLSGVLNLTGILTPTAGTFTTGNQLTLKSNVATTAVIAAVTGVVSGEMTIERYVPAKRAFRFMSSPVDATGTIRTNWQENGVDAPGWGTDITGADAELNGFDASGSNNPSLFTYNHNNATSGTWVAATSTNVPLLAGVPYRLMVRGDRTVNQHLNVSPPSITTLRAHGTIKTGNVVVSNLNTATGGYTLVGNPYQAAVNVKSLLAASTGLNKQFYYVWDPTRNTRGAYVTVDLTDGSNNISGSAANEFVQPNHAFFVSTSEATPALTFTEGYKSVTTAATPNLYRTGASVNSKMRFTLYENAMLAQDGPSLDGFVVSFNEDKSNAIDENDALKPVNQDENIGLMNAGKVYSFESRNLPTVSDVLPISHTQYRNTNYTYKIEVSGIDAVNAYLLDKFTNTRTELANNAATSVSFTVEASNQASSAANRFDVVFATTLGTDEAAFANGVQVYPNPVTSNQFFVSLPAGLEGNVTLRLVNLIGQEVYSNEIKAVGNVVSVQPGKTLQSGVYLLNISDGKETTTKKLIVK